jgi:membrane protein DedA with SNARE-associated domain
MSSSLTTLIQHYGYIVVAILVGAEGVGIPLPGESALLAAAVLAARGHLWFPWVLLAAILGVSLGGIGGYWIGRTAGYTFVTRHGKWVGVTPTRFDQAKQFFARYGSAAVVVGRFLPIIRILTGLVSGTTTMSFRRFAFFNTLAGVVWSAVFASLGYFAGRNASRLEHRFGPFVLISTAVLVLATAAVIHWKGGKAAVSRSPVAVSEQTAGSVADHRDRPHD